jgi:hypothetical protein
MPGLLQRFDDLDPARNGDAPLRACASEYDCDFHERVCDLDIMAA